MRIIYISWGRCYIYENAISFVKEIFENSSQHVQDYNFREKFSHTMRVYSWAKRLLETEDANHEILLHAVVFHDVGYTVEPKKHAEHSAKICEQYLDTHAFDKDFKSNVLYCIMNHHCKELLFNPNSIKEAILLIEADCLDESGTMSILRDAISEGMNGKTNYYNVYERLIARRSVTHPNEFFCVTETAKRFWEEKQKLYLAFVESLKFDLGI